MPRSSSRKDSVLVLDLDGTLLDARPRQVAALYEAARDLSLPHPDGETLWWHKRRGLSTYSALRALELSEGVAGALSERWTQRIEDDDLLHLDVALPCAPRALALVRAGGAMPVVLTARRRRDAATAQVARLFGDLVSDLVIVAPGAAREEKAAVLQAMEPIGYVADTELDATAAADAGVPFAAVGSGQRDPSWLRTRTRAHVFPDAAEAVRAILKSPAD